MDGKKPVLTDDGDIDYTEDFFGKETNLTVSGQLEAEAYAMGLGKVYTFGPTFRAENSNTSRHLAEFWMIEPEMAFYDLDMNMDLAEDFIKKVIGYILEHCQDDLQFFEKRLLVVDYVVNTSFVKYCDIADDRFSDDTGPLLGVSDVVAISSVKALFKAVQLIRLQRMRLTRWRSASALCGATTLRTFLRPRLCSGELLRVLRAGVTDKVLVKALIPRWRVVAWKFTVTDMRRHQSQFASTICYPSVGDLVCPSVPPAGQDSNGWLWVAFHVSCCRTGVREGWIHPGIVFGNRSPAMLAVSPCWSESF